MNNHANITLRITLRSEGGVASGLSVSVKEVWPLLLTVSVCLLGLSVPPGVCDFANAEMNAESRKVRNIWRIVPVLKIAAGLPQIWGRASSALRQSPLRFTCTRHEYSLKLSFTNKHHGEFQVDFHKFVASQNFEIHLK